MSKVYYPIEEQLERIAEETDFVLQKPTSEMNEDELLEAESEASKYVTWVEDDLYEQAVPMKKNGVRIYPI
jgi:hypothetical protein